MRINRPILVAAGLAASFPLLAASPALAAAGSTPRLSVGDVFFNAALPVQAIAVLLVAAIIAAPLLRDRTRRLVASFVAGAPLLALAAAAFTGLGAAVGYANSTVPPSATVMAPAWAEVLFLAVLGLLAAFSAVLSLGLAKSEPTGT
ncbi:hypothetical protein ASD79_19255 [Caulobacter sp. Root655]|uniref:hypothetical protein n=1 Tax=Caulobacter sp. Root655 TaxID=1736578 RepID=UPI0006FF19C8|nr:hypothetical protein [Caulobacter sp. Root655]KRA65066.1 hypothetical protein ASD79_19255 [Caulobacter sp. Root655]